MRNILQHYNRLTEWREQRHLSIKDQKEGYLRNVMEELGELADAIKNNDDDSKIDAICDIYVFTLNALNRGFVECLQVTERDYDHYEKSESMLQKIMHNIGYDDENVIAALYRLAQMYGYDLDIAMDETIKEISSRTGHYDDKLKKFVKDTSDEAKAKWYKADYERAKL